jgi:hypothetical protein
MFKIGVEIQRRILLIPHPKQKAVRGLTQSAMLLPPPLYTPQTAQK